MPSEFPVIVYGASGFTGRMVMEHLRDMGVPFVAAGRNRARIEEALKIVPGVEDARYSIAEVDGSAESLTKLFEGSKVVCNTVGPFMRFGLPVVEAALKSGLHYMDTSGEQHWVIKLRDEYGPAFAKAGLALAPSNAYMYGGSEIGARYCLETPGIDSLDMTSIAQAVPTVASAQTILDAVRYSSVYLKDNELVRYPGIETSEIVTPSNRVLKASQWGGTSNPIWFARDGRVRNCRMSVAMWNQELYKKELELERAYKVSLQWLPDDILYSILDEMALEITPATPPRENRYVHRSIDTCFATGNNKAVKTTLLGTGGYFQTGLLQAYGARRLMSEAPRVTGFASPCELFGHRELFGALSSYGYAAINVEQIA
jgi:Family of unknown function (DUF5938)/Saccharopine dehydrogenase NADP binding domain